VGAAVQPCATATAVGALQRFSERAVVARRNTDRGDRLHIDAAQRRPRSPNVPNDSRAPIRQVLIHDIELVNGAERGEHGGEACPGERFLRRDDVHRLAVGGPARRCRCGRDGRATGAISRGRPRHVVPVGPFGPIAHHWIEHVHAHSHRLGARTRADVHPHVLDRRWLVVRRSLSPEVVAAYRDHSRNVPCAQEGRAIERLHDHALAFVVLVPQRHMSRVARHVHPQVPVVRDPAHDVPAFVERACHHAKRAALADLSDEVSHSIAGKPAHRALDAVRCQSFGPRRRLQRDPGRNRARVRPHAVGVLRAE
jgi:hypothetical protein